MHFILALFSVFTLTHHELADEPAGPVTQWRQSPAAIHAKWEQSGGGYQAVTFWQGLGIAPYVGSFNHLWCDDYPFWQGVPGGMAEWSETVQRCVAAAKTYHLPPPLMVGQDFAGRGWRMPTRWEHWKMIQIAKQQGAAGILWWTHA